MVGVMCIPEPKPSNVLDGLSPSLASFMQQLPPLNGNAPDLDMLISILLQSTIPSINSDSTSMIPWASSAFPSSSSAIYNISSLKQGTSLNVSNMRSSNGGQGCGQLIKSSYAQSNITDPTLKLREGNGAHTINTSPPLQSFIDKLPIANGPSPNVDKVISVLFNGVIPRNGDFYGPRSTSRRANSSTMKSFQSSHQLKRKQDDADKEEVIHEKPAMDIFKLRQIRKFRAMAANQSGTTSQTSSRTSSSRS